MMGTPTTTADRDHRSPKGRVVSLADARSHGSARPLINTASRDLALQSRQTWAAIQNANDPPWLFTFGGGLARILNGRVIVVGKDELLGIVSDYVGFRDGKRPVYPPDPLLRRMLAEPTYPVPILDRVVSAPTFAADGTLQTSPGYHAASRTYLASAPDLDGLDVPRAPTDAGVAEARSLLTDELLGGFPFASDADRAHAIGALLLPFVRDLIAGPTPAHLIEAPIQGTGKTLLALIVAAPFLGTTPALGGLVSDEDENEKRLIARLLDAPAVLILDNLTGSVTSESLARAITAAEYEGRLLGQSTAVRCPVRCLWLLTANNASLSGDLARRAVRIRLDARMERPFERTHFAHDLPRWAFDHRTELVRAALILVAAWVAAGRPSWDGVPLGSFERWSAVIGGILDVAGVSGFLANRSDLLAAADPDLLTWRAFVTAWGTKYRSEEVAASELLPIARQVDGLYLGRRPDDEQSAAAALGRALRTHRDRVYGSWRIIDAGMRHGRHVFRLESLTREKALDFASEIGWGRIGLRGDDIGGSEAAWRTWIEAAPEADLDAMYRLLGGE